MSTTEDRSANASGMPGTGIAYMVAEQAGTELPR